MRVVHDLHLVWGARRSCYNVVHCRGSAQQEALLVTSRHCSGVPLPLEYVTMAPSLPYVLIDAPSPTTSAVGLPFLLGGLLHHVCHGRL